MKRQLVRVSMGLAVIGGSLLLFGHEAPQVSAQAGRVPLQGGSIPLSGSVPQLPDQEATPSLLLSPSGDILRVWSRLKGEREGGGAVVVTASPDGLVWRTLTQIVSDEKGVNVQEGQMAVSGPSEIAIAYRWVRFSPRSKDARLARSSDGGKTWRIPAENVDTSEKAFDPRVAWGKDKTLVVAWADERRSAKLFDIYLRRSTDGGATWEPEVLVTEGSTPNTAEYHYAPRLLGDGNGKFWLFWTSTRNARAVLTMVRSEDDGRTWQAAKPLSGDSHSIYGASIVRAGNRMVAIWEDQRPEHPNRVYSSASKDAGVTWSDVVEVDGLAPNVKTASTGPSIVLNQAGEAWAAWHDDRNGRLDIFAAKSTDGGEKWSAPLRIDTDAPGTAMSRYPKLAAASDGTVAVVWEDDRSGYEAVYARVLMNGQWSEETRLGPELPAKKAARVPRIIATAQNTFYVVWEVWDYTRGSAVRSIDSALIRIPK